MLKKPTLLSLIVYDTNMIVRPFLSRDICLHARATRGHRHLVAQIETGKRYRWQLRFGNVTPLILDSL